VLAPDEYINNVSGRHGDIYDRLVFRTNKGKVLKLGGSGGTPFSFDLKRSDKVIAFAGGVGGHIHNLSLIYV
jgi:hypothetical protein